MDQRSVVERARKGDHDAFALLVNAIIGRLDAAARLILRDPDMARDAVQEALIRAWRDLRGLRQPDRFEPWLYRLTVNACIDQVRHRRRRPIEVEISPLHDVLSTPDASAALADRELVNGVLARLDERERAIVVLHYFLGLPLTDVAESLRLPVGTVKSRLHRALGDMRMAVEVDADTPSGQALEGTRP